MKFFLPLKLYFITVNFLSISNRSRKFLYFEWWVWVCWQDRLPIDCNSKNDVESQNESFKYQYLQIKSLLSIALSMFSIVLIISCTMKFYFSNPIFFYRESVWTVLYVWNIWKIPIVKNNYIYYIGILQLILSLIFKFLKGCFLPLFLYYYQNLVLHLGCLFQCNIILQINIHMN